MQLGSEGNEGRPVRALLIIDYQNDFIPSTNGSLAVPNAEDALPVINKLRIKEFDFVYLCLDWHPYNHCSFRTNNPSSDLFQVITLPSTGNAQIMWPDHCVQGTFGADLHKDLIVEMSDIWTYAGCNPQRDSYSVFKDNGSAVLTEMRDLLEENKVTEIYAVGLATDFCVQYTLLDAKVLLQGVEVYFIDDGCKGISNASVQGALKAFDFEKVHIIQSDGPELERIGNRKLLLNGNLELIKRPAGQLLDHICHDIDELYEAIIFGMVDWDEHEELLHKAIRRGTVNELCSWSSKGLLHACCEIGDVVFLRKLLEHAGKLLNLTLRTKKDFNALMLAAQSKNQSRRTQLVRILLDTADDYQRRELLFGQTQQARMTAFMFSCRDGSCDVVELMMHYESSLSFLELTTAFGKTALMYACMSESQMHAGIVELILKSQPDVESRLDLLKQKDNELWNSLHFSAKSGCFACVDWSRALEGYENVAKLPINEMTNSGITFLHLAAFNGKSEVVRAVLDSHQPNRKRKIVEYVLQKGLRHRIKVNVPIRHTGCTELDLAIQRRHLETSRLLLRLGCHAGTSSMEKLHELLHRLVLMGDVQACESILNFSDENRITIDDALVETTQRIEHPETCTFSFANYTNPVKQHLYKCEICESRVCLVCKDRCHGVNTCRRDFSKLDFEHFPEKQWTLCGMVTTHCECNRDKCCATAATDAREIEGYRYLPSPLSSSEFRLSADLMKLSKTLATNTHNVWAKNLIGTGWTFGRDKDPEKKLHPHLLPFDSLSYEGAKYNIDMAVETLKVIQALGYKITRKHLPKDAIENDVAMEKAALMFMKSSASPKLKGEASGARPTPLHIANSASEQLTSPGTKYAEIAWDISRWECIPVDTSKVKVPEELGPLIRCLAENSHEVWASEKIRQGWRYAPARNIKKDLKLNSSLVPYSVLSPEEKEQLLQGVKETVKVILKSGWTISKAPEDDADEDEKSSASPTASKSAKPRLSVAESKAGDADYKRSLAFRQLKHIRRKLFNQYLFAAVRRGQMDSVDILLSKRSSMLIGANLNAIDEFGHTPLYIAIKRGHLMTARRLINLGANVELRDINGLTPLAISAYLGNLALCQELVQNKARILVCDNMGFTPLHHAAMQGHVEVCQYLIERLQQEHQSNEIIDLNPEMLESSASVAVQRPGANPAIATIGFGKSGRLNINIPGVDRMYSRAMGTKRALEPQMQHTSSRRTSIFRNLMQMRRPGSSNGHPPLSQAISRNKVVPGNAVSNEDEFVSISPRALSAADSNASTPRDGVNPRDRRSSVSSTLERKNLREEITARRATNAIRKVTRFFNDVGQENSIASFSPMSLAVQSDNIEIVALLIKHGANPMLSDGTREDNNQFPPYVRALFRHIDFSEKVTFLAEQISRRAMVEMQEGRGTSLNGGRQATIRDVKLDAIRQQSYRMSSTSLLHLETTPRGAKEAKKASPTADLVATSKSNPKTPKRFNFSGAKISNDEEGVGLPALAPRKRMLAVNAVGAALRAQIGSNERPPPIDPASLPKSTRELDELLEKAQAERDRAAKMIEVMNSSATVRRWRRQNALKIFMKETSLLIIIVIAFCFMVQLSPDYNINVEREWASQIRDYLEMSTQEAVERDLASFILWISDDFLAKELKRRGNYTTFLDQNYLFGGIYVEKREHFALSDDFIASSVNIAELGLDGNSTELVLPVGDPTYVQSYFRNQTSVWNDGAIQFLKLEFNLRNPFYDLFGVVEISQEYTFVGLENFQITVRPFRLNYGRFPPSREFQVVIAVMLLFFSSYKLRSWLLYSHRSRNRAEGWVIGILLFGILVFDVFIFLVTSEIPADFENDEYLSLSRVHRLLEMERRMFAVFFLLSMIPLLNAARTIPSIGPVVVALLGTMLDNAVIVYLMVVAASCFLLTLTFHVGFGVNVIEFSTAVSTFSNLFLTPFVESWSGVEGILQDSIVGSSLSVLYILFATIAINLLIAIVTDVYPNARKASDQEWEEIITDGIEDFLRDGMQHAQIDKNTLTIAFWNRELLLSGRDGIKHWRPEDVAEKAKEEHEETHKSEKGEKESSRTMEEILKQLDILTASVDALTNARDAEKS